MLTYLIIVNLYFVFINQKQNNNNNNNNDNNNNDNNNNNNNNNDNNGMNNIKFQKRRSLKKDLNEELMHVTWHPSR